MERRKYSGRGQIYSISSVRSGAAHFLVGRGASAVLGVLSALLLVRYMETKEYAVFITCIGLQIFVVAFSSLGLDRVMPKVIPLLQMAGDQRSLSRLVWRLFLIRFAASLFAVLTLATVGSRIVGILNAEGYRLAFDAALLYTLFFALSQHTSRTLQALMQQRVVKKAQFVEFGGRLIAIAVWLGYFDRGTAFECLLIFAANSAAGLTVMLTALFRQLPLMHEAGGPASQAALPNTLQLGAYNYFQSMLLLPSEPPSQRLIAAAVLPVTATAAYGFFHTLVGTLRRYLPVQILLDLIEPVVLAHYAQSKDFIALNTTTNAMYKINAYFLLPALGLLLLAGPLVVGVLTGGKYIEYAWVLPWLVAGLLYESHWIVLRTIINAVGRPRILVQVGLGSLLIMGLVAVGLSLSADSRLVILVGSVFAILGLQNYLAVVGLRRDGYLYQMDFRGLRRLLFAATVSTLLGWIVMLLITVKPIVMIMIVSTVVCVAYAYLCRMFGAFNEQERSLALRISRKFGWII